MRTRVHVASVLARIGVVAALVLSGLVVTGATPAVAVTSHRALNDTRGVVAAAVAVDFPIEWFGVVGQLPSPDARLQARGRAPYGEVRFSTRGRWTSWRALEQDGAQARGQFTAALLDAGRADGYQVRGLPAGARSWRAAAINTTDGPVVQVGTRHLGAASAVSPCRSRADWGADESLTAWSRGTDTQTFSKVQVLTVHHTAGSNDLTQDYAATVRAIYSYHVQSNGWSDIGYQYLIDSSGIVYEGRNAGHTSASCLYDGGTGSDFAHQTGSDLGVTGAHVGGWNTGNLGLSLMGCFEPSSSTCSGDTAPTPAAQDGLERLLTRLAAQHRLDPQGVVHYVNPANGSTKDVATISGHRDWSATACPGGTLYAALPTIRTDVAARLANSTSTTAPDAPASLSASAATATATATVDLTWTAPARDGGSTVTGYELFRSSSAPVPTSGTPVYSGAATGTTDRPVAGTYYYAVHACNAVGCGPSTTAGPVTVTAPVRITSASCANATCTFAATGTGDLTWDLGNGATPTGTTVSTTYPSPASYTVRVTDTRPTTDTRTVTCARTRNKLRCTV